MEDHGRQQKIYPSTTTNAAISYTPTRKFRLVIEVHAKDAAEAVAKVQGVSTSIQVEEVTTPQNWYGYSSGTINC